jgi:hypothetical protein
MFATLDVLASYTTTTAGRLGLDAIKAEVGYIDGVTLRTLLSQRRGRGVRDIPADLS